MSMNILNWGVARTRGTYSEPGKRDRKQKGRSDHVSDNKGAKAQRRCPVPYISLVQSL